MWSRTLLSSSRCISILALCYVQGIGCSSMHNLTPALLEGEPIVEVQKDFEFEPGKLRTFALVPASEIDESSLLGRGVVERHMLFALRNSLETLGYRYVESASEADMLATIDADDPYQEIDVPPISYKRSALHTAENNHHLWEYLRRHLRFIHRDGHNTR